MKKILTFAAAGTLALTLAACGSSEDASVEAEADTVEVDANDALEDVDAAPVAIEEPVVAPPAGSQGPATVATPVPADEAAGVDAEAAAAEAEAAAADVQAAIDAAEAATE